MIQREGYLRELERSLKRSRVVALIGPRQCGKTTLARQFAPAGSPGFFDLEDPVVAGLMENPMTTLADLRGLVVIDEAQRWRLSAPTRGVSADGTGAACGGSLCVGHPLHSR